MPRFRRIITKKLVHKITSLVLITTLVGLLPPLSVAAGIVQNGAELINEVASALQLNKPNWRRTNRGQTSQSRGMPPLPVNPPGIVPPPPETRLQQEARVTSIRTNIGSDIILRSGEPMQLAGIAVDSEGAAIHGLQARWQSSNPEVVSIKGNGLAVGGTPGTAVVTARAGPATHIARVSVIYDENLGRTKTDPSSRSPQRIATQVSPDSNGGVTTVQSKRHHGAVGRPKALIGRVDPAMLPIRPPNEDPLPDDETGSIYEPGNSVGSPPGKAKPGASTPGPATETTETGNKNFTFSLPMVSLPGRGIDLSLAITYNSLLFNKSIAPGTGATWFTYDVDSGYPAPGFRLGYGQIEDQSTKFTLIDTSGTRHALVWVSTNNYKSTDGTFLHYVGGSGSGTLYYPNGTQVLYGAAGGGLRSFPVKITDPNGNFIDISYVGGVGPRIYSITDTLQRSVTFQYDGNNDLVSITSPGITGNRVVMRFYYETHTFPGSNLFASGLNVSLPSSGTAKVIKYIYLPNSVETNTAHIGYRFYYSAYGMVYQIKQFRGMTVSADSSSVTGDGTEAASTTYNYPTTASNLSDAPTYSTRTDDWAGRTTGMDGSFSNLPTYTFSTSTSSGFLTTTVEAPDHTVTETKTIVNPGVWNDGLVDEIKVRYGSTVFSKTKLDWDPGVSGGSYRVSQSRVTDVAAGLTKATVFSYDTSTPYNNVTVVSERGFTTDESVSITELRKIVTSYVTSAAYINRHLYHLPNSISVLPGGSPTPVSRTDYTYDSYGPSYSQLTARSNLSMHDDSFDPFGGSYSSANDARGNVTSVTRYTDPATPSGAITQNVTYDIAGNVITADVDCCNKKSFAYSSSYNYAYPTSVTTGNPSGLNLTTSAAYSVNTGLVASTTDENNQVTTISYNGDSLRPAYVERPDGSRTYYNYSEWLTSNYDGKKHYFIMIGTQMDATRFIDSYTFFDGRGAVKQTFNNYAWISQLSPPSSNWSTQDTEYDVMGRPYRQSNPYYCGGYAWVTVNPEGFWTTSTFDPLGRVTQVTMPRGDNNNTLTTSVQASYAAETSTEGIFTTFTDQAGKVRRQMVDALGRVVRLDEPTGLGLGNVSSPNQATSYQYDLLDNIVKITQGSQLRYFKYDALGRMIRERQVEQTVNASYDLSDSLTGNNSWTRKIQYNTSGLVTEDHDARGVQKTFEYDDLHRLKTITYSDGTPTAHYYYDSQTLPSGAPQFPGGFTNYSTGRLLAMTYGSGATGSYFGYDRMGSVTQHFQVTGSNTYAMSYAYNVGGLLTSETYPSNRVVSYSYDDGARLSQVSDGTTTFANGFTYAPQGGLDSETWGNGAVHSLEYNRRLQPTAVKLKQSSGGSELQRYNYHYGVVNLSSGSIDTSKNNGQIGKIEGLINGSTQWDNRVEYDELGRLKTTAEHKQGSDSQLTWKVQYTFDRWGNRFQSGSGNTGVFYTPVVTADIDAATNRFINSGLTPTTYDLAGNILTDTKFRGMEYTYDANGRQLSAQLTDDSNTQTSVYDCAGQRVQTTANGVTRTMVYDIFGQQVADYSGSSLERENIYRGGELLAAQEAVEVTWTNAVGVSAVGNSLTKTGGDGWNAGAVSSQSIASGDGYVEITAPAVSSLANFMFGLSNGDSNQDFTDIDFALYAYANGYLYIYESGVGRGNFEAYTAGDKLRVAVEGGVVKYRKNGSLMYTSSVSPSYPLLVDTSLYPTGSTLSNAVLSASTTLTSAAASNLALNKTATQSSTFVDAGVTFYASRAIDGNTDGDLWDLSASATNYESQPWWQVDLGSSQLIGSVEVWPRTDCCTEHTANFYVFVSNSAFSSNDPNVIRNQSGVSSYFVTGHTTAATILTVNRSGRYVRVARTDSQYLVLGEVKVMSPTSTSGGIRYFLSDVQGSVRAVMNNSGVGTSSIVARHDYLPFGEGIWSGTGLRTSSQGYGAADRSRTRYGLTERDDSSGLDHTWFRKYEHYSGRWTSFDPYLGSMSLANPQSFNRYTYVQNDPVNFVDPSGLFRICFSHFEDTSNGDGPRNWSLTGYVCIDLIDPILLEPPEPQEPGPEQAQYSEEKLKECVEKLFRVQFESSSFNRATGGSFRGSNVVPNFLPIGGGASRRSISITTNVTRYNVSQLGGVGYTNLLFPWRNYVASDYANDNSVSDVAVQATWVHEVGNSLSAYSNRYPRSTNPSVHGGDTDSGAALEDCVFGGRVSNSGFVTPP